MSIKDIPYYYWDACVILSYIDGVQDRLPHIDALLASSRKDFQIITSVLSITEVAFATVEKNNCALDLDIEGKISQLWSPGSPIIVVEFYELIAIRAQKLIRSAVEKGLSLKPPDAIHLATADQLKVAEFHTYDNHLTKFFELTDQKFPIIKPTAKSPFLIGMSGGSKSDDGEPLAEKIANL